MKSQNQESCDGAANRGQGVSRRRVLQTLGAGAVAATLGVELGGGQRRAGGAEGPATAAVPAGRAEAFALMDVRLLEGPFLEAQKRDAKYLLQLEPDRMLHQFRVNAGLEPKGAIYGGWESVQTWADIRAHGHTLGHYLTACALMHASTADEAFKKRCDTIVADLQECQEAGKTGLVCAFPDKAAPFDTLIAGRRPIGVPWYTMHKIMAGLRDAHVYCGNAAALKVLARLCDWAIGATENMTEAQFQKMLDTEHGGMNEVLADVHALTGEAKYLALARRFCHKAVLDPLAQSRDALDGLHSNTQIPKIVGFQRLYALTGEGNFQAAAAFFWKTVVTNRSFATGGNGDNEHFFAPAEFGRHVGSAKTMETCCSYNMLRLTRMLFSFDPSAAYGDYYERALYNTILASQDPDSGMMTYFQSTRPGYLKLYCTPVDSFWCCTGTGMENHAKYGDSIYFHGKTKEGGDGLWVNLFIASTVNWKETGVRLTQTTRFPEAGKTRLEIAATKPVKLAMNIRHPGWCAQATVAVNGVLAATSNTPGSFIALERTWNTGDVVEVEFPMRLRMEALPGSTTMAAVVYGPIVLVGALGKQGIAPGADLHINERTIGQVFNEPIEVPALTGEMSQLVEKIKPAEAALTFKTQGQIGGHPADITLIPYYRVAHEHYNMYWQVASA